MAWRFGGIIRGILMFVLMIAGGFLVFDALFRAPFEHALMNAEGTIALSFLVLLGSRSQHWKAVNTEGAFRSVALIAIVCVVALAFAPILHTPFLYDDYTHITDASHFTWASIAQEFGRVPGHGLFFRPFGFFLYWLNYLWAGPNPTLWHAGNIALHAACAALIYVLCRELGLSWPASMAGALLFGLTGVAAESVAWIDAGFVMLTAAFVLTSLILVRRYAARGRSLLLAAGLAAGACLMLCKETGFSLPFLIASLAMFTDRAQWKRIGRATTFAVLLTIALFVYRWWALNGIGGYSAPGGEANILHFNLIRTLDALFLRQWAVLFFPFNWSAPSSLVLRGALT